MTVPNTDNIETTTLQLIRRRMADNVFKANPLAAWFLAGGRVQTENGGRYIPEPLMYRKNNTVQSYRGYDRLNVSPTEELTEAQYNWRQAAVSISISGEEELKNAGASQIFNLTKTKIKVAEMSLREWFAEKLHAATATKDTTKDFLGLDEIIDDRLNYSTVGGIDGNANSFWRNKIGPGGDGAGTMPGGTGTGEDNDPVHITGSSTTELSAVLRRMYRICGVQLTKPDLILTSGEVHERYEQDAQDKLRLTDTGMAELGFDAIKFKGASIMWSENIKTGGTGSAPYPIYFLNSEFMRFVIHAQRNFKMSTFMSPWDQDAKVAQILMAGQMTCNNRRHQGVCWVDLL